MASGIDKQRQPLTKVIAADDALAVQTWQVPGVQSEQGSATRVVVTSAAEPAPTPPSAEEIEAMLKQGHQEGYEQGHKEGLMAAQRDVNARIQQFNKLMQSLAKPFEALDDQVEQELLALVLAVARQLLRREIKTDPGQIVAVIREALTAIPVVSRGGAIHLHSEDAELARQALSLTGDEELWRIIEDPSQRRGGCRVVTDTSQVDASVEARLAAIAATLLGDERKAGEATP
ncbi:MAG: flagellar assembly protein FliH [Gammaproteobacteria bacterium]|nr:flagellar assembly protein FliH [Gammaproteobacteria bacterium]